MENTADPTLVATLEETLHQDTSPVQTQAVAATEEETGELASDWHFVKVSQTSECGSTNRSISDGGVEALGSDNASFSCESMEAGLSLESPSGSSKESVANHVLQQPVEAGEVLKHSSSSEAVQLRPLEALQEDAVPVKGEPMAEMQAVRKLSQLSQEGSLDAGSESLPSVEKAMPTLDPQRRISSIQTLAMKLQALCSESYASSVLNGQLLGLRDWLVDNLTTVWHSLQRTLASSAGLCNAASFEPLARAVAWVRRELKTRSPTLVVLAMGASMAVVGAFLARELYDNQKLRKQLYAKDRELANLVVKIFQLQDALQSPRPTPLLRHTGLATIATYPLF